VNGLPRSRWFLRMTSLVASVAIVVTACSSAASPSPATTAVSTSQATTATSSQAAPAATSEKELEIISPWTSGGENAALNALVAVYQGQYPGVQFVNAAVGGGGNTAAQPMTLTRLQAGNPPDIWQGHGGADLLTNYVNPGYAKSLNDLWTSEGWYNVAPKALVSVLTKGSNVYAVPFGIHRVNMLWYNKKVLDAQGITFSDTMTLDQFFGYADKLKSAGITPLCLGDKDPWTSAVIFEDSLLANLSANQYSGLWTGATPMTDPAVKTATQTYAKYLGYINSDHSALTWDQATQKVMEGKCAATLMGDWAYGEFHNATPALTDNVDFGWVPAPGSGAMFSVNNDIAITATNVADPTNAMNFLKVVGSVPGQIAFNKLKGAIPWRTDVDPSVFPPYQQYSMAAYKSLTLVSSVSQGLAAPPAFVQALNDAVTQFGVSKNVDAFIQALAAAPLK